LVRRTVPLKVNLPPRVAYGLAKLALDAGRSPAEMAVKILGEVLEEQGLDDDWDEVRTVAVETMPDYLSHEKAHRWLAEIERRRRR